MKIQRWVSGVVVWVVLSLACSAHALEMNYG